jgi:flagellar biosynthesis/type III secretory pathway protein FliH
VVREALQPDTEPCDVQIVVDPRITRGGCIVEADASRIDAQFESRVAAAFVMVLGEQPTDRSIGDQ